MVLAGKILPQSLASPEAKASVSSPCPHGSYGPSKWCPHYIAEEAARKARHARAQAVRNAQMKSDADKLIEAQQQSTQTMVEGVAEAVAKALTNSAGGKATRRDV
jgi:hypothetical protein